MNHDEVQREFEAIDEMYNTALRRSVHLDVAAVNKARNDAKSDLMDYFSNVRFKRTVQ